MRSWLGVLAMLAACAIALVGPAGADPDTPGTPLVTLTADRFGVVAGSAEAPVQLEFFCDPQCPDCAKFESSSGAAIGRYLGSGQLAVTYRWLTFLDDRRHNDTSARVASALMAAAEPATSTTSATAYQAFVADLYRHQSPRGSDPSGPGADDIAVMARESGVPEEVVDRIATGEPRVDTTAMNAVNRARLNQVNPESPGTPTVYDLKANSLVDIDQAGWLEQLVRAG